MYYPPSYYSLPSSVELLAVAAEHERYKLDIVGRFHQPGQLLEIGPATGGFALLAKRAGFDVSAIEMSPECCEFLSRVVGIHVVNSKSEVAALRESEPADVIALWHVVEHLRDPFELISVAAQRLRPGGILVIAAPNPSAFQFSVLRSYWTHVDAPRHLFLIPISVMQEALRAQGLHPLLITTTDPGSLGWNQFGWEYSLANFLSSPRLRHYAMRAGRLLTRMLARLEDVEGRGSAYTVVFQRPQG
jgi:SAM-dependent methyltransferase